MTSPSEQATEPLSIIAFLFLAVCALGALGEAYDDFGCSYEDLRLGRALQALTHAQRR